MNEMWEENKKTIITIGIILGLTIIIGIVNIFMNGGTKKITPDKALKEIGAIYYEELFYPELKETYGDGYKERLRDYSSDGIKVTLEKLANSIPNINAEVFFNINNGVLCNTNETYVIIYPDGSYEQDDYTLKVKLDCAYKLKEYDNK